MHFKEVIVDINSLLSGIVVGCFIVPISNFLWSNYLLPEIISRRKHWLDISGQWQLEGHELGRQFDAIVKINQKGDKIKGEIFVPTRKSKYKFEGIFRDTILTATYEAFESKSIDRGVFALKYEEYDDGQRRVLRGNYAWYNGEEKKIVSGTPDSDESPAYFWTFHCAADQ
jgi:hypothetical protein